MTTITITEPWTYRTPEVTIDYPAGEHEVSADIAAAYEKDKAHGDGIAADRPARAARKAQG